MPTVTQIREGIQTRLNTISGLRAFDYAKGTIEPPTAIVVPDPGNFIDFDATMGDGADDYRFLVYVLVAGRVNRVATDELDGYISRTGATSIKTAIEGDPDLGSVVHFTNVTGVSNYGDIEYAGITYFGAVLTLEVTASGS
jgi:hypothetical protein